MELKPIKYNKRYDDLITKEIIFWFWENIFKECFAILKNNTVYNDNNIIISAIQRGLIYYKDGVFYSKSGRFSSQLSIELEKLGAKFSKFRGGYILDKSKIPTDIISSIEINKVNLLSKIDAIKLFLTQQLNTLKSKKIVFDDIVNKIMLNLQERVYKNAKEHKIELITPKLDDFRENEIAERYTNNLDFWIKNWTEENIIKMREKVGKMAINGQSQKDVIQYLMKEFEVSKRKAEFLARNETAIATTSYLQAKYKEEGFTHFKWHTNIDGRERPLHRKLNNMVFSFDNPPIIDERTGQRGLPGETYNCRCTFSPVVTKEFWQNRRKLFKANNSLLKKIKDFIHVKRKTAFNN